MCRDLESVPSPCVYLQVEGYPTPKKDMGGSDGTECWSNCELHLVPSNPSILDDIFSALCTGAELNPDADGVEDSEPNKIFFGSASSDEIEGEPVLDDASIQQRLSAYDRLLENSQGIVEGQFDDADTE